MLLDPSDRLIMLRVEGLARIMVEGRPAPATYWITVGGGLEPGESFEAAARREVFEETGIVAFALGPVLWERDADLRFDGATIHAFERYYAGWCDVTEVVFDHHDEEERRVIVEHRWWALDELTADPGANPYFPEELPALFAEAIRRRPRVAPPTPAR